MRLAFLVADDCAMAQHCLSLQEQTALAAKLHGTACLYSACSPASSLASDAERPQGKQLTVTLLQVHDLQGPELLGCLSSGAPGQTLPQSCSAMVVSLLSRACTDACSGALQSRLLSPAPSASCACNNALLLFQAMKNTNLLQEMVGKDHPQVSDKGGKPMLQLLYHVSAAFRPGILTCLMGVSGAGVCLRCSQLMAQVLSGGP